MKGQIVNSKCNGQKCDQIEVITDWQYTQEISPAFKRLMTIILGERISRVAKRKSSIGWDNEQ